MPFLDRGQRKNCEGVDFGMGFLSIVFVLLINLRCVQQFNYDILVATCLSI